MAVPPKYRHLGDFHEYYSGARKAPYLTIFVGGNHEASNHLWELYYGGWVAPKMYYMGAANVLRLGPLRIAGLSGIWKGYNYNRPHSERLPYNQDDVRSIYHVRELDTRKLLQLRSQVDVGISHDWPRGVEWLGDYKWLFKKKDLFEADAKDGKLGSVAARKVLDWLRPSHWFSAHLHVRYEATVNHGETERDGTAVNGSAGSQQAGNVLSSDARRLVHNEEEIDLDMDEEGGSSKAQEPSKAVENPDRIDIDDDEDTIKPDGQDQADTPQPQASDPEDLRSQLPASFSKPSQDAPLAEPATTIDNTTTRFLALDKCLPSRKFLELLEIPASPFTPTLDIHSASKDSPYMLHYDPEWLAITRVFAASSSGTQQPHPRRAQYAPLIDAELRWVNENIVQPGKLAVPDNFEITAPVFDPNVKVGLNDMPREYDNPQTRRFCDLLGIENDIWPGGEEVERRMSEGPKLSERPGAGRRGGGGGRTGRGRGRGFGRGKGRGR